MVAYVYLFCKRGLIIATRSIIPFVMSTVERKKKMRIRQMGYLCLFILQTRVNNSNTFNYSICNEYAERKKKRIRH